MCLDEEEQRAALVAAVYTCIVSSEREREREERDPERHAVPDRMCLRVCVGVFGMCLRVCVGVCGMCLRVCVWTRRSATLYLIYY
jgi:hypothetical protein